MSDNVGSTTIVLGDTVYETSTGDVRIHAHPEITRELNDRPAKSTRPLIEHLVRIKSDKFECSHWIDHLDGSYSTRHLTSGGVEVRIEGTSYVIRRVAGLQNGATVNELRSFASDYCKEKGAWFKTTIPDEPYCGNDSSGGDPFVGSPYQTTDNGQVMIRSTAEVIDGVSSMVYPGLKLDTIDQIVSEVAESYATAYYIDSSSNKPIENETMTTDIATLDVNTDDLESNADVNPTYSEGMDDDLARKLFVVGEYRSAFAHEPSLARAEIKTVDETVFVDKNNERFMGVKVAFEPRYGDVIKKEFKAPTFDSEPATNEFMRLMAQAGDDLETEIHLGNVSEMVGATIPLYYNKPENEIDVRIQYPGDDPEPEEPTEPSWAYAITLSILMTGTVVMGTVSVGTLNPAAITICIVLAFLSAYMFDSYYG